MLYGMWAVEWHVGCFMVCGLLYGIWLLDIKLQYMWTFEWYVGCCWVCGLLNGMLVIVWYEGC